MKRRGRRSADALLATVTGIPKRPEPPVTLPERQKAIWRETVMSKTPDWWDGGSLPLLSAYVSAVHELELVNEQLGNLQLGDRLDDDGFKRYTALVSTAERVGKLVMALARAQRLGQSSRYHPRTAATHTETSSSTRKPWELEL
jgi:hypothetical protein